MTPSGQKQVLVTGATSGIGLATAKKFATAGYEVGILSENSGQLAYVVEELTQAGFSVYGLHVDLSKPEQVTGLIDRLEAEGKSLDVLVNNAGIGLKADVTQVLDRDFRLLFEINFFAALILSRDALKHMCARRAGNIIQVSSAAARRGLPGMSIYSSTKAAMHLFSESMRVEAADYNVHITELLPMTVRTPFFENAHNTSGKKYEGSNFSVTPERVADLVLNAVSHPAPEVYTSTLARIGLALNGINPKWMDAILLRQLRKAKQSGS